MSGKKSRYTTGIIWFGHRGYNQNDELVVKTKRTGLMLIQPRLKLLLSLND